MKKTYSIEGMHCASCATAIDYRLHGLTGIVSLRVDRKKERLYVEFAGDEVPLAELNAAVAGDGYSFKEVRNEELAMAPVVLRTPVHGGESRNDGVENRPAWWKILLAAATTYVAYRLLLSGGAFSSGLDATAGAGLLAILAYGAVASVSTCGAVVGGLVLSFTAAAKTRAEALRLNVAFHGGRLVGFAVLGGLAGLLGQAFSLSARANGAFAMAVGILMAVLGLHMAGMLRRNPLVAGLPPFLSRRLLGLSEKASAPAAAALGALTFFLPCGFTQAAQVLALASGGFGAGAAIMGTFALGTVPGLLAVGALAGTARVKAAMPYVGIVIVMTGLFNFMNGWRLADFSVSASSEGKSKASYAGAPGAAFKNGWYEVPLKVVGIDYVPNVVYLPLNIPTRLVINGSKALGCMQSFAIPKYAISTILKGDKTVVEFTPTQTGKVRFTCSMGMGDGTFIVVPSEKINL